MKKIYSILAALILCGIVFSACEKDVNPSLGKENPVAAIFVVKKLYKGTDFKITAESLTGASKTGGIVISNLSGKNFPKGSLIIQSLDRGQIAGLLIDLGAAEVPFEPGDSVVVDVVGGTLAKTGESLQIKGLSAANITKIASGKAMVSRSVSMGALAENFSAYENTLVKITADTKPLPVASDTYAGDKTLDDGSGSTISLYTNADATFAGNSMPASATYTVIPFYGNTDGSYGSTKQVRLRTQADVSNASGPIYPGWPESFESPDFSFKGSYNMNTPEVPDNNVQLKTGNWKLLHSIFGNTAGRDRFNAPGLQSIRFNQNLTVSALLQMNFDLPNGASKVTLWHGAYYTDAISTFRLEYSIDGGKTWLAAGPDVKAQSGGSRQETFLLNIKGNVRFRINKLGLGATSIPNVYNGRLSIEDIAIYSN